MQNGVESYLRRVGELIARLEADQIARAAGLLAEAVRAGKGIFVAGNGGSAATASHFAADFGKNVVPGDEGRPRVLSLCDNAAAITAYANDEGYERAFSRQLANFMGPGDLLMVISASGNSPSVVRAMDFAHGRGGTVIALTGFSGGQLMERADLCLHAPDDAYETVEDAHSVICHCLVYCVKAELKKQ